MATDLDMGLDGRPVRVQLRRTKGWRMPENTVSVARPGRWGNPFRVGELRTFINKADPNDRVVFCPQNVEEVVEAFQWLATQPGHVDLAQKELAGKNLACWCPLDAPCHADVLLELANKAPSRA